MGLILIRPTTDHSCVDARNSPDSRDEAPAWATPVKVAALVVWAMIVLGVLVLAIGWHELANDCGIGCGMSSSVSNAPGP